MKSKNISICGIQDKAANKDFLLTLRRSEGNKSEAAETVKTSDVVIWVVLEVQLQIIHKASPHICHVNRTAQAESEIWPASPAFELF